MGESRLLTLDEACEADIMYYESTGMYCSEYGRVSSEIEHRISIIRLGWSGWAYESPEDYGKTWRCWSWKPTEEQMKAVEWK